MKISIALVICILLMPIAIALEECLPTIEPTDSPCKITLTYQPSNQCTTYQYKVFNQTEGIVQSGNLSNLTNGFCFLNFNQTLIQSYFINLTTGDTANITIGVDDMMLAFVLGIGILCIILLLISYFLDESHVFLKFLMAISAATLLILIPTAMVQNALPSVTLYTTYIWIYRVLWIYIFVYSTYYFYKKYMLEPKKVVE